MLLPPLLVSTIRDTQAQAIREKGFAPDPERYAHASMALWDELRERNAAGSAAVQADLEDTLQLMREVGPFQNPAHLFALVKYNREILDVTRRMGIADDSWVPFASATFGSVNASTTVVRQHYVVIYNDGLFSLLDLICSQLSYALGGLASGGNSRESLGDAARRAFHADSEVVQALLTTIISYVTTGDPRRSAGQIPEHLLPQDGVHRLLRDTAMRFVVAHEVGHVYLRHLERSAPRGPGPAELAYHWQDEYDADGFAAKVVVRTIADARTGTAHGDPLVELLAVEVQPMLDVLVSSARDYLTHGGIPQRRDGQGTHPPSDRRFAEVRATIHACLRESPVPAGEVAATAGGLVDLVVWALLPPLRNRCLELRQVGVRPV